MFIVTEYAALTSLIWAILHKFKNIKNDIEKGFSLISV